jgi:hypothetical protein
VKRLLAAAGPARLGAAEEHMARLGLILLSFVFLSGCLAAAAVNAAGNVAGSAIRATGSVVGAGVDAVTHDEDEDDEDDKEKKEDEKR